MRHRGGGRWILALALAAAVVAGAVALLRQTASRIPAEDPIPSAFALAALAAPAGDFPDPEGGPLSWPRDHAARLDQLGEYWLFAGVLASERGERFGFQLGLLRVAMNADAPQRRSPWGARDLYAARLALTPAGGEPEVSESVSRGALGLAGASTDPPRVWVKDWEMTYDPEVNAFRLSAAGQDHRLELHLAVPAESAVTVDAQSVRGYWMPSLAAEGVLSVDGRPVAVAGDALLDRAWGRALPAGGGQLGLVRLWLALDDGTALRCQQLRRRAGGGLPLGECRVRAAGAHTEVLDNERFSLEPVGWRTVGHLRYPLEWRLRLDGSDYDLRVGPLGDAAGGFAAEPWSGTMVVEAGGSGWGLLELSNFARSGE